MKVFVFVVRFRGRLFFCRFWGFFCEDFRIVFEICFSYGVVVGLYFIFFVKGFSFESVVFL